MVPLAYYCLLNLCPPFGPVPPAPAPVPVPPLPVLPGRTGGAGAAGGGGGLFVSFPGYKDPYKDAECERVETELQQVEAVLDATRPAPAPPRVDERELPPSPEDPLARLIRQAERRIDIEDAEERGRGERDARAEVRLLAARLYARLREQQLQCERDDWLRQLNALTAELQQSEQRTAQWQQRWETTQIVPVPAPLPPVPASMIVPLAALPPQSVLGLDDPDVRRVWVGASVTAAVASAAIFSLFVLGLATEAPAQPAPPVARKRRRR
jgi:hypothetical protein